MGDVELGIQTVCMLLSKVVNKEPNKQDQYFSNVALKVNTKLGGINHKVRYVSLLRVIHFLTEPRSFFLQLDDMRWLRKKSTMMVGIDVTHRGPGTCLDLSISELSIHTRTCPGSKAGTPSIAAVVASVDNDFVQYPASLRLQRTDKVKEVS